MQKETKKKNTGGGQDAVDLYSITGATGTATAPTTATATSDEYPASYSNAIGTGNSGHTIMATAGWASLTPSATLPSSSAAPTSSSLSSSTSSVAIPFSTTTATTTTTTGLPVGNGAAAVSFGAVTGLMAVALVLNRFVLL